MTGRLFVIMGRAGAGKSTVVSQVLHDLPDLQLITTATTRPRRDDEVSSLEHTFVSDADYDQRKASAKFWYETEYTGFRYGTDAGAAVAQLGAGHDLITIIAPDPANFAGLAQLAGDHMISIWIDTPAALSQQRIVDDEARAHRPEDISLRTRCTHVFTPTDDMTTDARKLAAILSHR